ncbi:hypothetical protein Hanom_Chr10g00904081 [Helianthus anomalus]
MELIDIKWCMASTMRRAQRFMEITGRSSLASGDSKLGEIDEPTNPFRDDYYKKAIYHRSSGSSNVNQKQIDEGSSKARAMAVIHDDEGYDWSQVLPEEDAIGYAFVTNVDHDRWWRNDYARWEFEKFREPFKEAQRAKRWNDELECYMDPRGNPVVDPSKVDFEAVTKLLPSQATLHTRRLSDKEYLPDLVSKIKEVCEASLPKVVEMKKRKEEELKKMVEEVKVEKLTQKCQDFEKENKILKEKCLEKCVRCVEKDNKFQDFQKEYDNLKWSSQRVQDAYDTLKRQVKSFDQRLSETLTTKEMYERKFREQQLELNKCVNEVANLKQVLVEKEKIVTKLQSYHNSSYILERIFNIAPDDKDTEKNTKGIGSEYHQVPPPLRNNYTFYDEEKVAKGLNIVAQLPESIDVTYAKSDEADDSEVVSKVVESVLKDESTKGKSESHDENEGNLSRWLS